MKPSHFESVPAIVAAVYFSESIETSRLRTASVSKRNLARSVSSYLHQQLATRAASMNRARLSVPRRCARCIDVQPGSIDAPLRAPLRRVLGGNTSAPRNPNRGADPSDGPPVTGPPIELLYCCLLNALRLVIQILVHFPGPTPSTNAC